MSIERDAPASRELEITINLEPVEREDGVALVMLGEDGVSPVNFYTWAEVDALLESNEVDERS